LIILFLPKKPGCAFKNPDHHLGFFGSGSSISIGGGGPSRRDLRGGCPGAIHEPRRGPGVDGRSLRELSRSRGSRLSGSMAHERQEVLPVCRSPPRRPADRLEVVTGPERGARADRKARLPGRGWTALAFFCRGKLLRCANICTRKALGQLRGDVGHDQIVYAFVEGRYTSAKRII